MKIIIETEFITVSAKFSEVGTVDGVIDTFTHLLTACGWSESSIIEAYKCEIEAYEIVNKSNSYEDSGD